MTSGTPPVSDEFVFVLEQTLGNAVHGRNLERVLARPGSPRSRVVRIDHDDASWRRRWPVLGNWTLEASARTRRSVTRLLTERPASALYVHTAVCAALLGDVMRRVPTVLSTDATPRNLDTVAQGYGHVVRSDRVERAKLRVTGAVYRAAAAVVAQSQWVAQSLVEDYGVPESRVVVLSQGADVTALHDADRVPRATGERLKLLFVGADLERKGGHLLLEAVGRLAGEVELDLVTRSPVGSVPPHVRVHRALDHDSPELAELFRRADVFVLPSLSDASPLALGEALAAGLPVVGTRVGALPEMARDGVTGLVVQPGSVDALVAALRALLDDDLRRPMGQRARALALERYDAEKNNQAVLDVLRTVSARPAQETTP